MNSFQEAIKALLVKACDEGMTRKEAAEALGVAVYTVNYRIKEFGLDWPRHGNEVRSPDDRALDILARTEAGETLQSMAEDYGITRERVRQIVKKFGGRSKRAMHEAALMKMAQTLKEHPMTLSEAARTLGVSTTKIHDAANIAGGIEFLKMSHEKETELSRLAELVRDGVSFRRAAEKDGNLARQLQAYCREKGIKNRTSTRWSNSPRRSEVITKLYLEGKSWKDISAAIEDLEGVQIKNGTIQVWAYNNLDLPRRVIPPKPRKVRVKREVGQRTRERIARRPVEPVEIDLRATVRETAIANRDRATAAEIAAACGCTRNSVIGYWFRARQEGAIA